MISGLKPYPAMKDSGVPWLGVVPARWDVRKLRGILRRVTERDRPDLPLLSVVREQGVIHRDTTDQDKNHNYIPDDLSNYKVVRVGQFAMNKMKAWQGSYGVSQYEGIVSPAYFVFDITGVGGRFFHAAIRSRAYVPSFAQASDGVRIGQWDLAESRMREITFAVPPFPEQAAIIRFLDHADRRIWRYIRAKQKLIKLLEEQNQAVIHHAVTRGLDPSVRLKPSGVEWLGDVPEHWEVTRLKFAASHIVDCLHATPEYIEEGEYPAIRTADVAPGKLDLRNAKRLDRGQYERWTARLAPRAGDTLYTREGERFGLAAVVPEGVSLCISQRMMVFRIRPFHSSAYMMWQLNCPHVYAQAAADVIGTTSPHVNVERIRNFKLLVPPRSEQRDIAVWIGHESASIDQVMNDAQREIALLREYRTRLIADVVTGKLDVRAAAASLPAEIAAEDVPKSEEEVLESGGAVEDEFAAELEEVEGVSVTRVLPHAGRHC